jgi:hypothetical protein
MVPEVVEELEELLEEEELDEELEDEELEEELEDELEDDELVLMVSSSPSSPSSGVAVGEGDAVFSRKT